MCCLVLLCLRITLISRVTTHVFPPFASKTFNLTSNHKVLIKCTFRSRCQRSSRDIERLCQLLQPRLSPVTFESQFSPRALPSAFPISSYTSSSLTQYTYPLPQPSNALCPIQPRFPSMHKIHHPVNMDPSIHQILPDPHQKDLQSLLTPA